MIRKLWLKIANMWLRWRGDFEIGEFDELKSNESNEATYTRVGDKIEGE